MTISVRCSCGAKLKAKEKLAGKRVACPACKKPLVIPVPEAVQEAGPDPLSGAEELGSGQETPSVPLATPMAPLADDPLAAPVDPLAADPLAGPLDPLAIAPLSSAQDPLAAPLDPLGLGGLSASDMAPGSVAGGTVSPLPTPAMPSSAPQQAAPARQAGKGNRKLLIAAIGGGATALLLVGSLVVFLVTRGGKEVVSNDSAPETSNTALPESAAGGGSTAAAVSDTPPAAPGRPAAAPSSATLDDALRSVIREMIRDTGAGLSESQTEAEVAARYQEGVDSVRQFYPGFLDPNSPNHALPALERISIAKAPSSEFPHDVPLVGWLDEKYKAGELDGLRTELLAQLFQAEFRIARHGNSGFDDRRRVYADKEKKLYPDDPPSLKYGPLSGEERQCQRDLFTITQGIRAFQSKQGSYPKVPPLAEGQVAGLSWRVQILPYVKQEELYNQFKLDESWDSPHNRQLIEKMPACYKTPGVSEPGTTAIHVFTGEQTVFRGGVTLEDIKDEYRLTMSCVASGPETAVEWTRPGGIAFDQMTDLSALGTLALEGGIPVAFLDGGVMSIPRDISFRRFAQWVLPTDGQTPDRNLAWAGNRPDVRARWPFGELDKPPGPADRLKRLGFAMHAYHDRHKHFPTVDGDGAGKKGLSWRVHLLPFLGEQELYDEFHLEEAWDSPHNLALVDRMPDAYRWPGGEANKAVIHMFTGPEAPFDGERGLTYADFKDGVQGCIMAVLGAPDTAVEWTRPGGLPFDRAAPYRGLAQLEGGYAIIMVDGWPHLVDPATRPEEFSKLIPAADGQAFLGRLIVWKTF